ncbi:hypothetical protein INR77_07775 [Erythrobacter sp. SCSIO 43205]|uniref:hypothetical protein n=1 Tax=Erythrobacter sp. SCSIO 43205 TaxID=2779361 RepID=UPI001CA7F6B3|nr:hypothetical protein [Erythrobacter sp. SCSIO 43205]UAB79542.1 hypothetical protein INR77_07775 [Erythrobacter sp. SCSIO 43205]
MEPIFNAISTINPALALVAGMAIGALATLAIVVWKPHRAPKSDPLSNLFEGDTLQSQIARVADQAARSERADRDASAIRAKIFARTAARAAKPQGPCQPKQEPPHRAERYDHQAVLDHIAKVMRAGSELDKAPQATPPAKDDGQWEEVLLLPPPSPDATTASSKKVA